MFEAQESTPTSGEHRGSVGQHMHSLLSLRWQRLRSVSGYHLATRRRTLERHILMSTVRLIWVQLAKRHRPRQPTCTANGSSDTRPTLPKADNGVSYPNLDSSATLARRRLAESAAGLGDGPVPLPPVAADGRGRGRAAGRARVSGRTGEGQRPAGRG